MERDQFLKNIADRLGRPTNENAPSRSVIGVTEKYASRPFGNEEIATSDWPEYYSNQLESIGGKAHICETAAVAAAVIGVIISETEGEHIVTWDRNEFAGWDLDFLWEQKGAIPFIRTGQNSNARDLTSIIRSAHIGITSVDFAVVNTGSIVLYTNASRNRSVSLLPSLHIALVRESQLVARLGEDLPISYSGVFPSSIHIITGPSRSADIENDLSIGVHGPAAVTVVICKGL